MCSRLCVSSAAAVCVEIPIFYGLEAARRRESKPLASGAALAAVATRPWAIPSERRLHIFLCRKLKGTLAELWPQLREWE